MHFSSTNSIGQNTGFRTRLVHFPFVLRIIVLSLIIVALARPQSSTSWQNIKTEAIDIVIAFDLSSSMLARDFEPDRLEAAKMAAVEFVQNRPSDRIGLVVYSAQSFTQCPITTDHEKLINLINDLKQGLIDDGTAIGMGLTNAVNRLKNSDAKSKVIILLTDGENNSGEIAPTTAAEIAASFDIKVYTIGVGTHGTAPMPTVDMFGRKVYRDVEVSIDEPTLKDIAKITKGKYFRATDNSALTTIYEEIDKMEKSVIEETQFEKKYEEFFPLALLAFALLMLEYITRKFILKSRITDV